MYEACSVHASSLSADMSKEQSIHGQQQDTWLLLCMTLVSIVSRIVPAQLPAGPAGGET